jgi:DNA repair exonuclease SbcCD nuclease subunit
MMIVGDVHGKYYEYYDLVKNTKSSFQLGDFGFESSWNKLNYSGLDSSLHKVGQGNHDPHSFLSKDMPYWTGRFGKQSVDNINMYWIGGALSIDLVYRIGDWLSRERNPMYKTWWSNEQLDLFEMEACKKEFLQEKPRIVVSHTCPSSIIQSFAHNKSSNIMEHYGWGASYNDITSQFLQLLWEQHQPELWLFGHFHHNVNIKYNGTNFICLGELQTYNI